MEKRIPGTPAGAARRGARRGTLPPGWKLQRAADGALLIFHPPNPLLAGASALALLIAAVSWYFIGRGVADALRNADVALGLGMGGILLALNSCVGAVIWVTSTLRDVWRLDRNFLEVREKSFDGQQVAIYSSASLWIIHRDPEEGDGWFLRVQTPSRVAELYCATKAKLPCLLAQQVAERTGWELHLPQELRYRYAVASARQSKAVSKGPPPGLGFEWKMEATGLLLMTRRSGNVQMGFILLILGVLFIVLGVLFVARDFIRGGSAGVAGLVIFLILGLACAANGIRPAFSREEWRLGDNFLEVRHVALGEGHARQYTGGSLTLLKLGGDSERWHLIVFASQGQQGSLAIDLTPEMPLLLGEFIAECTGWQLQLPNDLKQRLPQRGPGAGPDLARERIG